MDKKEIRAQIEAKLETVFAEFGQGLSEKKFKKHIKKAGKLLSEGLVFPTEKIGNKAAVKVVAKKVATKTVKKAANKSVPKKAKKTAAAPKSSQAKEAAEK